MYKYEIDENNAIRVWEMNPDGPESEQFPFLFQPNWPCGTKWASSEEADYWASMYLAWKNSPDTSPHPPTVRKEALSEGWPFE